MARLMWLIEAAEATGYPYVIVDGWEDRGYSDGYAPAVVVAHHTAGPTGNGDMPSLGICVNGRTDLPGPLANYCLGRSGTIYIVASGKSNNAGSGSWKGYDSNYDTVGIEAENDGSQPWPNQQLDSYAHLCAEILRRLNRDSSYLCGHKEWAPSRKVDPHSLSGPNARSIVQDLIDNPNASTEDDMFLPLKKGDGTGDESAKQSDVAVVQYKLNRLGAGLATDGVYGDTTVAAVKKYLGDTGTSVYGKLYEKLDWLVMQEAIGDGGGTNGDYAPANHNHDARYVKLNTPVTVAKAV